MPSYADLRRAAGEVRRARRVRRVAQERASRRPRGARASGHAARDAGAGDVRPHRRRLRPHELGHDRRHAPPLARARGRPGARSARARGRSTSPAAPATWRSSCSARAARRGGRARLLRARCSSWRARKAPGRSRLRVGGQRARAAVRRTARSTPATVGFGARNFADLDRGLRRDGARRCGRAAGWSILEITTPQRPPLSLVLPALVRPGRCPRSGRLAGDPDAYTLPARARCAASRARASWPAQLDAAGLRDVRWVLTAGGIIAIHAGHASRVTAPARQAQLGARARGRRRRSCARLLERTEARLAEVGRRPRRGARRATRPATLAAGGKRLRPMLVFLCGGGDARRAAACAAAAAVELLHMATLVHDDVLDRAPLRRGRPTVFADGRPAGRHRHRRPALLARLRRAGATGSAGRGARAVGASLGARARRADAARRRLDRAT